MRRGWRAAALAAAAVLAVPALRALAWLPLPGSSLTDGGPTTTWPSSGNVPRAGLDFNAQRRPSSTTTSSRPSTSPPTWRGEETQPDVSDLAGEQLRHRPYRNADAGRQIDRAADAIDAPILVGAVVLGARTLHLQHRHRLASR